MNLEGKVTMLFDRDRGLTIEVRDQLSRTVLCKLTLDNEQAMSALARLAGTDCMIDLNEDCFDKIGKKMLVDSMTFKMPEGSRQGKEEAITEALNNCPEGWEPDLYFGSQDSFTFKDGEYYAKCTIRKWIHL